MLFTESLKNNYEFRRLYRRGKCDSGPYVAVYFLKNRRDTNRLGITTGGKIGNAVTRNLIRRRIHEAYRLSEAYFHRGYDIVVVARKQAVCADYKRIETDLLTRMKKLGLMK